MSKQNSGNPSDSYRVTYCGVTDSFPFGEEGSEQVSRLVEIAEQEHNRIEVRYKRLRMIYYFDYDRPRSAGKSDNK